MYFDKEQFFADIKAVEEKHNVSISHEDSNGMFIITKRNDWKFKHFKEAYIEIENYKEEQ